MGQKKHRQYVTGSFSRLYRQVSFLGAYRLAHETGFNLLLEIKMNGTLNSILNWFKTAKPEPTLRDKCTQLGAHFEEVSEMLRACNNVYDDIVHTSKLYYSDYYSADDIACVDREELLDSLCDQIVTAIGVGHMFGMDILGALVEVDASNWSKFEDGKPLFDSKGKITKGRNYRAPELRKFMR